MSYKRTNWTKDDVISPQKLNKIEKGIEDIEKYLISPTIIKVTKEDKLDKTFKTIKQTLEKGKNIYLIKEWTEQDEQNKKIYNNSTVYFLTGIEELQNALHYKCKLSFKNSFSGHTLFYGCNNINDFPSFINYK